jgi:ParB-like chromosome segregation protein Spo0J
MERDPVTPEDFSSDEAISFPCARARLVPATKVVANDYNPNRVAVPELDLLERSIRKDGVTQPVVTSRDAEADRYVVVDGFHRYLVMKERFGLAQIPVTTIGWSTSERKAATVRHNQARGEHQTELMGALVESLVSQGVSDSDIAKRLGMEQEELLRLKQIRGIVD